MHQKFLSLKVFLLLFFLSSSDLFSQLYPVTVKVIAPKSTPEGDSVCIVGNVPEFGEWFKCGAKMKQESNNIWSYTVKFAMGTHLEFKITRGSWLRQAMYQPNVLPPNITWTVTKDTTFILTPIAWQDEKANSTTGTVRYHHNMEGDQLKNLRDVIIWLPPSYFTDSKKRYPVLYMHDGQNIFDAGTSGYGYDWRVDEVCDSLIRTRSIDEIIVVGIYNTKDRFLEYNGTKEGRAYADFIVNTLKPFIDSKYRTKPDRENTAVMGSSMGGLISFYIANWYPEVFSKAACLANAFDYDEAAIMNNLSSIKKLHPPVDFYLDCGDKDIDKYFLKSNEVMYEWLKKTQSARVEYFYAQGTPHNENAWAHRIWRPLIFMFGL